MTRSPTASTISSPLSSPTPSSPSASRRPQYQSIYKMTTQELDTLFGANSGTDFGAADATSPTPSKKMEDTPDSSLATSAPPVATGTTPPDPNFLDIFRRPSSS